MSVETLNELGITTITPTSITLKMADYTPTKPFGELSQVSIIIVGKPIRWILLFFVPHMQYNLYQEFWDVYG